MPGDGRDEAANAIDYAQQRSRSQYAVIHVYDEAGNVIKMHEHAGDFVEPQILSLEVAFPVRATAQQCIASGPGRRS
jgi:hypothetical protein